MVFHHDTHTHPFLSAATGAAGSFVIPRNGHPESDVFYRVYFRAADAWGLADTAFVDVAPRLVTITLTTNPGGLMVTVDHQPVQAPVTIVSVVGMERSIGVPQPQTMGGIEYEFGSWSNGGAATQTLVMPATDPGLVASFREAGVANIPPTVSLSSPAPATILTAGTSVTLQALSEDANGTVSQVEFFQNGVSVGVDAQAPFAVEWTPTGTGQRQLTARATDDRQAYTMSAPVSVTVQAAGGGDAIAPSATLVAPAPGARGLVGSVVITATASDNVGVARVEFDLDGALLGSDATAPFEATLTSTAAYASGAHVIRARAFDAAGNVSDPSERIVTFGGDVPLASGFTRTTFASGFGGLLTAAVFAPDGRMFVAEQSGALRVVKNGVLVTQPAIKLTVVDNGERGLLGIALHPSFAANRLLYLYYTTPVDGTHNRISRFVMTGDVVLPASEVILANLPAATTGRHNGGAMQFGGDGKLYIAVGDNGDGSNAPLLTTPFGKMLRLNADGSIPSDNPFASQTTGFNRAIWARGLRNPFSFAFEPGTGRMHMNDVGVSSWEEINLGRAGADYGWPTTEGPTNDPAFDTPLLAYGHANSPTLFEGFAIVGAAFYRPPVASFGPSYVGSYFFADYVVGWVYRLDPTSGKANAFAKVAGTPTGLLVGPDGALFILNGTAIDRISR